MKGLFGFLFLFAMLLVGCKKDYNCSCEINLNGYVSVENFLIENKTKSDANTECKSYSETSTTQVSYFSKDCKLD